MKRLAAALILLLAAPALAATTATPATLAATIAAAKPGDTITLAPGSYGTVTIAKHTWSPPVTIDASKSGVMFTSITISSTTGLAITSPRVNAATIGSGINITGSKAIVVFEPTVDQPVRNGLGISLSSNVTVTRPYISRSGSDGIDVTSSDHVMVDGLTFINPASTDGAHADAIQIYSSGGQYAPTPVSYITAQNVLVHGNTQAVDMFGNLIPADHIVFDNIYALIFMPRGISMTASAGAECNACQLTNSKVYALPGAPHKIQVDPLKVGPYWTGTIANISGTTAASGMALPAARYAKAPLSFKLTTSATALNKDVSVPANVDMNPWKQRLGDTGPFMVTIGARTYLCIGASSITHKIGLSQPVRPVDAAAGNMVVVQ